MALIVTLPAVELVARVPGQGEIVLGKIEFTADDFTFTRDDDGVTVALRPDVIDKIRSALDGLS